ncbi:MAG: hypothetical protein AVDCRST_MAG66-711, partial [uncultured Pseudonocardia sp.]
GGLGDHPDGAEPDRSAGRGGRRGAAPARGGGGLLGRAGRLGFVLVGRRRARGAGVRAGGGRRGARRRALGRR